MMTFYMTPGSCSTGIHILLEELEQVFSATVLNLPAGDGQKPEYLAINPKGTIPTLVLDDGTALTDFVAIAWWLAQRWPKKALLPSDPTAQAVALDRLNYLVGTLHGHGFTRIFTPERYLLHADDRDAIERQGRTLVQKGFHQVAQWLEASPGALLYEQLSIVDAALFYNEFWANRLGMTLPSACQIHYQAMTQRPTVQQVLMEEGYRQF
ncbi:MULTISPECIES: glutathione S-transferase family protein [unclassified Oceanobacter]|uniref:glutathione S-transferase family protein n=1 Tax=unclassified Oceanobacter TaxID=2620260 RepID=UPI0026E2F45F|nr:MULTISPECIES: glutathione S-transferase N-terminal domain-containing protein [unclassified Oceanobacter]MDO6683240.1 glutathione S-transferase N-terminal domain-containing protein [Oceanobacter sp. 5_MG-2023]MDP2504195.1 glutathione S-transferase N-terminal domain-containing protein [Oceanobacter sp. 3_MG-2023]